MLFLDWTNGAVHVKAESFIISKYGRLTYNAK